MVATSRRVGPLRLGANPVRVTLETIQAGIDKLAQALSLNTEDIAKEKQERRQENAEIARQLDAARLNAEAIAKNENEIRQENTEVIRRLDTVRLNTEAIAKKEDEIDRRLEAVRINTEAMAKNEYELRQENTELRILAEAGFLRFAVRVDAVDFRAFAAIMLTGNRYQAADSLQIPQTTFWKKVETWPARGADYKRLYRMIEWRKKTGRKIKVRLDDSLLGTLVKGKAENPQTIRDVQASMQDQTDEKSRDELLRDILQAIASQNAQNWQSVRAELIEILKQEVPE